MNAVSRRPTRPSPPGQEGVIDDSAPWALPRAGFPVDERHASISIRDLADRGLSVSSGDVILPALAVVESALDRNLRIIAAFAEARGCLLAPHSKTTMSPWLMRRQLDLGAWGMSVASVAQAAVAFAAGASKVFVANVVVGTQDHIWIAKNARDGVGRVLSQVDSPEAVQILDRGLALAGHPSRHEVLVEVGAPGGRTGARNRDGAVGVARAVAGSRHLALAGVSTYEGVVGHDRRAETLARIDAHLDGVRTTLVELCDLGLFADSGHAIVSAGGTRYLDRAVERLAPGRWGSTDVDLLVRPGSYSMAGDGLTADDTWFAGPGAPRGERLMAALEAWADVLAVPEVGLAIVGIGKKHVGERPKAILPSRVVRRDGQSTGIVGRSEIAGIDDQHTYLRFDGPALHVGDRVAFVVGYPASLEPWRTVLVVDDERRITDGFGTAFA